MTAAAARIIIHVFIFITCCFKTFCFRGKFGNDAALGAALCGYLDGPSGAD
jgi:hypothetical protein